VSWRSLLKDREIEESGRFYPNGRKSCQMRTSFSLVDLEKDAEIGMLRLAEAIRDWRRKEGLE